MSELQQLVLRVGGSWNRRLVPKSTTGIWYVLSIFDKINLISLSLFSFSFSFSQT